MSHTITERPTETSFQRQWQWQNSVAVADLRGARLRSKFLSIPCSFLENLAKSYVGTPPPEGGRPLLWKMLDPPLSRRENRFSCGVCLNKNAFYRLQGKVMFLFLFVCSQGVSPLNGEPLVGRPL